MNYQHDLISMVPLIFGSPCYYTCSMDVGKQLLINENKTHLAKGEDMTAALMYANTLNLVIRNVGLMSLQALGGKYYICQRRCMEETQKNSWACVHAGHVSNSTLTSRKAIHKTFFQICTRSE